MRRLVAAGLGLIGFLHAQQAKPPRPEAAASAAGESSDTVIGLRIGPPRPWRMVVDNEATLPNGVRVAASENREIPMVNVFVVVPAGTVQDPEGKSGLAEITSTVVRRGGTAGLTGAELQERLDELSATLTSSTSDFYSLFSLRVPAAGFAGAAAILRDLITAPRLDPEAVDDAIAAMHEAIGQQNQNPVAGLTRLFRRRVHEAGSPWARTPDYDALDNLTRRDIETMVAQRYSPSRTVIAVDGDIAAAAAKAKLQELFGGWQGPTVPPDAAAGPQTASAAKATENAVLFADRDDLRLSGMMVGHLGGRVSDADFAAMQVLCDILDAPGDGRIPGRVRANGGWRADWDASWDAAYGRAGEFSVRAALEPAYTTLAVTIIKEELSKLRDGSISEQDVERSRVRILARLALRYQSSAEQSRERAIARFHGLPADQLARSYQSLATLTRADVVRAAARNLPPAQIVVVAGNSRLFDKQLGTLGVKVETAELMQQAARPLKARTDPESLEKGKQLLAKVQVAMGGAAKLAAVRDSSIRQEGVTLSGERMANIKLWDRWMDTGVYRQDQDFGVMQRSIFYNGKIAWMGVKGAVSPLPAQMVPMVRSEMFRLLFRLLLSDQSESRQVADLGGNVLQITEGAEQGVRVYLDPSTLLPQRLLYRVNLGNGVSLAADETLSEWKEFDGIMWPTKIVAKKNGRRSDELTVVEAKFNSGLKAGNLEEKP